MNLRTSQKAEVRRQKSGIALGVVLLLALVAGVVNARTAGTPWRPPRLYDSPWYQKNQWRLKISNFGTFGYADRNPGGEWPANSGDMYIYGAGVWIGCLKRVSGGKDTLVSIGYNPNSGASEMAPACCDNAPGVYGGNAFERVYIYPEDWPPNPAKFPEALRDSVALPLRIPGSDDTLYFHYIPRSAVSSADAWAVFSDNDPARHTGGGGPIGVDVYQTTYSWSLPWNRDIVFFKLDVRNRTSDTIRDMYLGMVCDADVGNAANDRTGLVLNRDIYNSSFTDSVHVDNMGFVYSEQSAQDPDGLVGFDFLQSPFKMNADGKVRERFDSTKFYPDGIDENGNGLIDEPAEGEQIGMTAFKTFTLNDADPINDFEQYLALAGYDYWKPEHPYNPYDSFDVSSADKRFLQATGPFTLAPNELSTVTIGLIAANRGTGDRTTQMPYYLALASRAAQSAYDNNWIMPEPPSGPAVTAIPGDGRVSLVWDNLPEAAVDRFYPVAPALLNPHYVEQDFQGYKVYRSRTGQPDDWMLLTQFDRKDGITWQDTMTVDSLRTKATDAGLAYSYVDSAHLRLGFPYYYAVTSYDINYISDTVIGGVPTAKETLSLESGISGVRVVPRTQPANYSPPGSEVKQVAGNTRLNMTIEPMALVPHAVKDETYRLQFQGITYDPLAHLPNYGFMVTDSRGRTRAAFTQFGMNISGGSDSVTLVPTVFDSAITSLRQRVTPQGDTVVDTTRTWVPLVQMTVKLRMNQIPDTFYDRLDVVKGRYSEDSLVLWNDAGRDTAIWAYRGSNYRLVWRRNDAGGLIPDVHDIDNDLPVPYRYLKWTTRGVMWDSADGWCFQTISDADSLLTDNVTKWMYLCGARFTFKPSARPFRLVSDTAPGDTLVQPGDTWILYTKPLSPAPVFAAFDIHFTPMRYLDTLTALDVKAVPNPYIARNEWERHPDFRVLKFINLPRFCTIRLYNLAGDLVWTRGHDATRPGSGSLPNQFGGDENWNLRNDAGEQVAPGVYIFHVESDIGNQVGKFVVIY